MKTKTEKNGIKKILNGKNGIWGKKIKWIGLGKSTQSVSFNMLSLTSLSLVTNCSCCSCLDYFDA